MTPPGEPDDQEGLRGPGALPLGGVVEVSVRVLRRHARVLLAVALLVVGPGVLLTSTLELRLADVVSDLVPLDEAGTPTLRTPTLTRADVDRLMGAAAGFLGGSAIAGLLGAIAALGFSVVAAAEIRGRRTTLPEALRACVRRSPTALGVVLVTSAITVAVLAVGGGVALAVLWLSGGDPSQGGPGVFGALVAGVATVLAVVYLTVRWAMALPAAILEDLGTRHALSRTWELTTDNVWRTFAIVGGATLATIVLGALVAQALALLLVDVLAGLLGYDPRLAAALVGTGSSIIVAPIPAVMVAVLYHDLRIRQEGGPLPV